MMKENKCQECDHSKDFKACALKHITTARTLLANGDIQGAEHQLNCVERHLREIE